MRPGENGNVWGNGVWLGAFVSMVIPFSISVLVGLKFRNFWVRLAFLLICAVLGFVLFALFGTLWAGLHPAEDADGSIRVAFGNQLPGHVILVLIVAWFAIWRLPKKIDAQRSRIGTPSDSN